MCSEENIAEIYGIYYGDYEKKTRNGVEIWRSSTCRRIY
jgi:hypothetical protein